LKALILLMELKKHLQLRMGSNTTFGNCSKEATCLVVYQGGENTLKFELVRSLS